MMHLQSFIHLSVRSYFSIKDGAFSPEDLVRRTAELGMAAVALTDRDGLYGAPRFAAACRHYGVRPIFGAALTVRTIAGDRLVTMLAKDAAGFGNLCQLITSAQMSGERGDPALTTGQVCERADGLICLLGPESEPGRLAIEGRPEAAGDALRPYLDAFGSPDRGDSSPNLFVDVRNHLEPDSTSQALQMVKLTDHLGVPAVATNSVRYLVPEDAFLADVLECMREIVPLAEHHVSRRNAEGYLKSPGEMRALFTERSELCDRTVEIAERCEFDLRVGEVHFPEFPTPRGRSAGSVLAERCWRGMTDREMRPTREVRDRLDHELALIKTMGYAAYFLTVADIVDDIRAMGIRVACRGSATGSLVCYLTRISDVDPVRHGLLFERFINPLRDELPDIDIDVESARRKEVYDAILARYGDDRCACVNMVDTFRARGAIREVGKALGLPEGEVDLAAKAFPHIGAHHVRAAMEHLPELEGLNLNAGQLEMLFHVVERLNGFPRHIALHPSGVVLSRHDLPDRVPLERSFEGYRMVQADKDDVELLGLLKLDVLGVRMLSAMRHCLDEVARTEGEKVDLDAVPQGDPQTFELIRSSDTLGCFQIESPGQRELLQKFQPTEWPDLIVDISLFRPGPVKSDMITPFLNRRHNVEPVSYPHPFLEPALAESYGVVVYHEQVMKVLAAVAGYDLSECDRIRRHLADDIEVERIEPDFLERAVARGVPGRVAKDIWGKVLQFASFGFCKAHAAAFAVPTYQSAWLKAHYPAHFLAGVLTHEPGMYPRRLILEDARQHGIEILPLDINLSEPEYTVEVIEDDPAAVVAADPARSGSTRARGPRARFARRAQGQLARPPLVGASGGSAPPSPATHAAGAHAEEGSASLRIVPRRAAPPNSRQVDFESDYAPRYGIRLALKSVMGISDAEVRSILEARAERPFTDVGDVLRRTSLSRPVAEALAHAGAFDRLPGAPGSRRDRLYVAMVADAPREGEQMVLPLRDGGPPPGLREYTSAERVRAELEVLGVDATRHLLEFYRPLLEDLGVTPARDLGDLKGDRWLMVAGVKVASQTPAVRSGQRIIFLTLDDGTGLADVTVFERVQPWCAKTVFHGFVLAVWGRLRRTGVRGASVVAERVWDLTLLAKARREGKLAEVFATEPSTGSAGRTGSSPIAAAVPPLMHGIAVAPTRKVWHASGGSAGR
jgi:error-prone DNA polymerase